MPITITQKLAENHRSLVLLDERIRQAELRRDYPPLGSFRLDSVVQEELRVLYVSQAKLLQQIEHLKKDLIESDFSETFQSVLETARLADEHAARKSGHPSFIRHLFPGNRESQSF
jgi:hypothetical protein